MDMLFLKAIKDTVEAGNKKVTLEVFLDDGAHFKVTRTIIPNRKYSAVIFKTTDRAAVFVAPERIHHILITSPESNKLGFNIEKAISEDPSLPK